MASAGTFKKELLILPLSLFSLYDLNLQDEWIGAQCGSWIPPSVMALMNSQKVGVDPSFRLLRQGSSPKFSGSRLTYNGSNYNIWDQNK